MKAWLEKNEIYFKTFGFVAIGLISIIVAHNAAVNQHSLAVQQLEITRLQGKVTRLQISPSFNFRHAELGYTNTVFIENTGAPARHLTVKAVAFIENTVVPYRVELKNWFDSVSGPWDSSECAGLFSYMYADATLCKHLFDEENDPRAPQLKYFVELRYLDQLGQEQVEQFVMGSFGQNPRPVSGCPTMDHVLDMTEVRSEPDGRANKVLFCKRIEALDPKIRFGNVPDVHWAFWDDGR
jgi:hypothetical protein